MEGASVYNDDNNNKIESYSKDDGTESRSSEIDHDDNKETYFLEGSEGIKLHRHRCSCCHQTGTRSMGINKSVPLA